MGFDEFDTIRMFFTFHHHAFIAGFLCIWTTATDGLARFDTDLLLGLFFLFPKIKKKEKGDSQSKKKRVCEIDFRMCTIYS